MNSENFVKCEGNQQLARSVDCNALIVNTDQYAF